MARGKKKESLTLEEKLEQALVPVDEQPYKVPENWCWTRVCNIGEVVTGSTPSKKHDEYYGGSFPFFKPSDLDVGENVIEASEYLSEEGKNVARFVPKLSTAVCCIGSIGKSGILKIDGTTNQQINSIIPIINPYYVYYYTKTESFVSELWSKSTSTTIPMVNKNNMEKNLIPLAPLEEQQRIVQQIESLFSKLDEAEEKLLNARDEYEIRKQSILNKAFSGELTKGWREENNVFISTWKEKTLDSVCRSIYDGDHMPPPKSDSGINFLVISNVNTGHLSFEDTRYVPNEYYEGLTDTRKPEKGDILYTLVGSYGIPVVVNTNKPFCFQRHMGLLKPIQIDTYFLWYQLQTQEFFDKVTEIANGTAQLTVPIKGLRKLTIKCPTEAEQKKVVELLDELFEKLKEAQEIIEQSLVQIEIMKKSILEKSFRGELGTNNPQEETSIELLKKILEE